MLCSLFFLVLFRVDERLLGLLESRFPNRELPTESDGIHGILLLGGSEDIGLTKVLGEPVFNEEAQRIIKLATLALKYPKAKIVVTGGVPDDNLNAFSEAEVAEMALLKLSVPNLESRLIKEKNSHNTYENFVNVLNLLNISRDDHWIIVTSACHMPRAVGIARKLNWNGTLHTASCNFRTAGFSTKLFGGLYYDAAKALRRIDIAFREYLALFFYYFRGQMSEFLPSEDPVSFWKHEESEEL